MLFELIITVQNVRRTGSVSSLIIHKAEEVIIVMKHPICTGLCFKTVIFYCNASFVQKTRQSGDNLPHQQWQQPRMSLPRYREHPALNFQVLYHHCMKSTRCLHNMPYNRPKQKFSIHHSSIYILSIHILLSEINPHLPVECTPGFLQAIIIIQFLIRKILAFQREVIASILDTIRNPQIV